MPSSRGRHPRNRSASARRRQQRRRAQEARGHVTRGQHPHPPSTSLAYGPGDHGRLLRGVDAEARGDAAAALELHRGGPHLEGSLREQQLLELVQLGAETPPWVVSRWIARQAHRWLLTHESIEMQEAIDTTFDHAYRELDEDQPFEAGPIGCVAQVAARDWLCHQLAVYEYAGLRRFLDTVAQPGLLARADRIEDWLCSQVGGYRLEAVGDDRVLVTDLSNHGLIEVLNIGSTYARNPGAHVLGRLVPVSVAPGLMFESRPLEVDERTARGVAHAEGLGPEAWIPAIGDGIDHGRLEPGFSLTEPTSFVCDLPAGAPSGLDLGCHPASPQDRAVALVDLVLDAVDDDRETAAHLAPLLMAVLLDADLRPAVGRRCVGDQRSRAWAWLARALPEPWRSHGLSLGQPGEQVVA